MDHSGDFLKKLGHVLNQLSTMTQYVALLRSRKRGEKHLETTHPFVRTIVQIEYAFARSWFAELAPAARYDSTNTANFYGLQESIRELRWICIKTKVSILMFEQMSDSSSMVYISTKSPEQRRDINCERPTFNYDAAKANVDWRGPDARKLARSGLGVYEGISRKKKPQTSVLMSGILHNDCRRGISTYMTGLVSWLGY